MGMRLQDIVDVMRKFGALTMGDVATMMMELYTNTTLISSETFEEYCEKYQEWAMLYESNFPGCSFEEVQIWLFLKFQL